MKTNAMPDWKFENLYCKLCRKPMSPFTMSEHTGICKDCLNPKKSEFVYVKIPKEKKNEE